LAVPGWHVANMLPFWPSHWCFVSCLEIVDMLQCKMLVGVKCVSCHLSNFNFVSSAQTYWRCISGLLLKKNPMGSDVTVCAHSRQILVFPWYIKNIFEHLRNYFYVM
jgi:hypothetical protein